MKNTKKQKAPWLDMFLAGFLFIYCWGTLGVWVYEGGIGSITLNSLLNFWRYFIIYSIIPFFFAYGVYKYNKNYFDERFKKKGN